tara:strand:- start:190 stop:777 length:588 start_codon:yes stop_codon:yes gene_type:complete
MKRKGLLLICALYFQPAFGQLTAFQTEYNELNKNLMIGLGSYAVSNFVFSGIGYSIAASEQAERFHEMNMMWNSVNLCIAIPGYLKAKRGVNVLSMKNMIKMQKKTETIFLINSFLDVGYISTGIWMLDVADNQQGREELFRGYGNSFILQGSFLLALDLFAYIAHHQHSTKLPVDNKISLNTSKGGIGIKIYLD